MSTKEEILSAYVSEEGAWWAYCEGVQTGYKEAYDSLRNQAAIAAMQGILSHEYYVTDNRMRKYSRKQQIEAAVDYANLLMEELKKNLD